MLILSTLPLGDYVVPLPFGDDTHGLTHLTDEEDTYYPNLPANYGSSAIQRSEYVPYRGCTTSQNILHMSNIKIIGVLLATKLDEQ